MAERQQGGHVARMKKRTYRRRQGGADERRKETQRVQFRGDRGVLGGRQQNGKARIMEAENGSKKLGKETCQGEERKGREGGGGEQSHEQYHRKCLEEMVTLVKRHDKESNRSQRQDLGGE